jgi:hypothetical protein
VNHQEMATFLERLGHRVVRGERCSWYEQGWRFFAAIPHSQPISPGRSELNEVFRAARCFGVRYVSSADAPGRLSYALMLDDRSYDLDSLSGNSRSKIRRGLKDCQVRRLEPAFVRLHGRKANEDTLRRIRFAHDVYDWDRYWDAVAATPDVEVWGALRDQELLAYMVAVLVEGSAELLIARSCDGGLRHYPNNALLFTLARDLLRRSDIERIFFGLESVEAVDGVDTFKESMGFTRRPIRQRIVFHPLAEPIARARVTARIASALARRPSAGAFWRKLEGLLAFDGGLEARRDSERTA